MRRLSPLPILLLAACAAEPPPRTDRSASSVPSQARVVGAVEAVVPRPPVEMIEHAADVLRQRGFVTTGVNSPGRSVEARRAETSDAAWATCPAITVRDPFAEAFRSRTAEATDVQSTVTVLAAAAPDNATRLVVRARHIGTYLNSYTNNPEEAACRSTGVLEQTILDAIVSGG
jgi:hypothetical protein